MHRRSHPCDGTAYAFSNRRQNRLKLPIRDGTCVWLCQRRPHRGHFTWPTSDATPFALTPAEWDWLTTGIDRNRPAKALGYSTVELAGLSALFYG